MSLPFAFLRHAVALSCFFKKFAYVLPSLPLITPRPPYGQRGKKEEEKVEENMDEQHYKTYDIDIK